MDRRRYDREPTNLKAYARVPREKATPLRVRDISSDGAFVEGWVDPAPRGTDVRITFVIGSGPTVRLLHRSARVARIADDGVGLVHRNAVQTRSRGLSPWASLRWPSVP